MKRVISSKCTLHAGNFILPELAERDSAVGPLWLNGGEIEWFHRFSTQYPGHLLLIRDQVIGREHTHECGNKFMSPRVILLYVFMSEELLTAYNCHLKNPPAERSSSSFFF